MDRTTWLNDAFGARTPWGDYDSLALVTGVESAVERELMVVLTRAGAGLKVRELVAARTLLEQGDAGDDAYLLLDGVLSVEMDGREGRPRRARPHRRPGDERYRRRPPAREEARG